MNAMMMLRLYQEATSLINTSEFIRTLNQNSGAAQTLVATVSLIVTFFIFIIYMEQNKISAAQHKASVDIIRFSNHSRRDSIELEVSNFGDGPAKNLTGVITPRIRDIPDSDLTGNPTTTRVEIDKKEAMESENWNLVSGSSLGPRETEKSFILQLSLDFKGRNTFQIRGHRLRLLERLYFDVLDHERERIPIFRETMSDLAEEGIDRLELEIKMEYLDGLGERNQQAVLHYMIPVIKNISLETALEEGCELKSYLRNSDDFEESLTRLELKSNS